MKSQRTDARSKMPRDPNTPQRRLKRRVARLRIHSTRPTRRRLAVNRGRGPSRRRRDVGVCRRELHKLRDRRTHRLTGPWASVVVLDDDARRGEGRLRGRLARPVRYQHRSMRGERLVRIRPAGGQRGAGVAGTKVVERARVRGRGRAGGGRAVGRDERLVVVR